MSWFSDFMHPGQAYKAAEDVNKQYYDQAQGYQQPYNDRGNRAGGTLEDFLNQLKNPEQLQNEWAAGYKESPYAKQQQQFAQNAGLDSASSQGLLGSSSALQNIQNTSAGIVNQDQQQYMNDLMQKYLAGIGIGQDLYGQGANAAGQQAGRASQFGQDQAGLEFNRKNAGADLFGRGLGWLADAGLNVATGGGYGLAQGIGGLGQGASNGSSQWLPKPFGGR